MKHPTNNLEIQINNLAFFAYSDVGWNKCDTSKVLSEKSELNWFDAISYAGRRHCALAQVERPDAVGAW